MGYLFFFFRFRGTKNKLWLYSGFLIILSPYQCLFYFQHFLFKVYILHFNADSSPTPKPVHSSTIKPASDLSPFNASLNLFSSSILKTLLLTYSFFGKLASSVTLRIMILFFKNNGIRLELFTYFELSELIQI